MKQANWIFLISSIYIFSWIPFFCVAVFAVSVCNGSGKIEAMTLKIYIYVFANLALIVPTEKCSIGK